MTASRAALTVGEKSRMTAREVVRGCPHAPEDANPCPCGIRWARDIDGDWCIADRWASPPRRDRTDEHDGADQPGADVSRARSGVPSGDLGPVTS